MESGDLTYHFCNYSGLTSVSGPPATDLPCSYWNAYKRKKYALTNKPKKQTFILQVCNPAKGDTVEVFFKKFANNSDRLYTRKWYKGVVEQVYPTKFKVKYEDGEVGFVGRDTTEGVRILN